MIRTRDVTVAALLVALMAASLDTRVPTAGQHATTPLAYALLVLAAAPIATHRRWPLPSVAVAVAAVVAYSFGHFSVFPGYPLFVLVFAVGLHAEWHTATVAYATALAGLGASLLMQPAAGGTASTWISTVLALTVAWLAGENLRTRRGGWTALRERADRLERDTRQAVADERLRIARELHDVVAHSM